MKKIFATILFVTTTIAMMAVPAKKGVWKTLKLQDGTEVRAQLTGDEHGHFWLAEDGKAYAAQGDAQFYKQVEKTTIAERAKARRAKVNAKRVQKRTFGHPTTILGNKKAIILLVNFKNQKFNASHNNALYQRIANEAGFSEGNFKGSMADYFKAQSRDKFTLDFDVVGPLTVSKQASYYGSNDSNDQDMHPAEMICEAVELAKEEVSDWTPYDWDGDGYVDQVYVVYAGQGEADGGASSTIWPHAYDLYSAKAYGDGTGPVEVGNNLYVNSYACGSELNGDSGISGIGVMCHEYSHCLGYPDFYDIDYSGGQGMGPWDLMDQGSYNGDGFQPAGYTSYERWFAGWEEPIELKDEDVEVRNMKSLQNGGEFYIIYNDKNANEYYLLENRQLEGWDASLPNAGMLILHCDYNAQVWENNAPNDEPNHQRLTVVPADGKYQSQSYMGEKYYTDEGIATDPFPYNKVNAFNKDFKTSDNTAKKAAQFFTKTSNGTYWMNGSVEAITKNSDKTISFNYVADYAGNGSGNGGGTQGGDDKPVVEGALFYESFDQCPGTGGNDGQWGSQVAGKADHFIPDNDGWTSEAYYGGSLCARFGSGKKIGVATSPEFTTTNEATLTFNAAGWGNDGKELKLSAEGATVIFEPATVTLKGSEWTTYTVKMTGAGNVKLVFTPAKRFFLDEVLVMDNTKTAIENINTHKTTTNKIYTIDGRFVGTDPDLLPRGLYIINGKKFVK